jgi:hypothetical protein
VIFPNESTAEIEQNPLPNSVSHNRNQSCQSNPQKKSIYSFLKREPIIGEYTKRESIVK